jgi:hypothetical protein
MRLSSCAVRELRELQVGDEHVSGRMRDHLGDAGFGGDRLRGHAAGPEYRDIIVTEFVVFSPANDFAGSAASSRPPDREICRRERT